MRHWLHRNDQGSVAVVPWLVLVAVMVAIGWSDDALHAALRYDRVAVQGGELWRLVTAHFVHLGTGHLVMNLLALLLVMSLFVPQLTGMGWWFAGIGSAGAIAAGLYWLTPEVMWYVGFSGILHGLIAAASVAALRGTEWRLGGLFGLLLAAKLVWEQHFGPLPGSEQTAGGPVLVEAHLYGALGGLPAGWWFGRQAQ